MSEISNRPVDNLERLHVDCAFFTGIAGVRRTKFGGQFAFAAPFTLLRVPIPGTVGGRAVRIIDLRKSDIADRMLVANFDYEGEA